MLFRSVKRDDDLEIRLTSLIAGQHPDFEEQLQEKEFFYLHKEKFLDEQWFLNAFETWENNHIRVLGFQELRNNQLNPHKGKVTVRINSGIDWFNTALTVQYGKQKASLKQLHQSIRNKSKFVRLDDGSLGILPEEWLQKFADYFQAGEVIGEWIKIPKNNFTTISSLTDNGELSPEVKVELAMLHQRLNSFENIRETTVPAGLLATLRDYQKQGLNWLNCLDEFNFGACLADDMGLGKTIQIITFILLQRTKQQQNTNLEIGRAHV